MDDGETCSTTSRPDPTSNPQHILICGTETTRTTAIANWQSRTCWEELAVTIGGLLATGNISVMMVRTTKD
jgi:hypothetical protein